MQPKKNRRTLWQMILLGGVVIGMVALALLFVDISAVIHELRQAKFIYLGASSLFLLLGLACFAARWRFLLQGKPGFRHTFHASNIGHAGNMIIPGRAGEPIRIVIMGQEGNISYTESVSSFMVERLFEQMMRLLALSTAVAVGSGIEMTPDTVVVGVLFLALMFTTMFWLVKNREITLRWGTAVLSKLPRIIPERANNWLSDLLNNLQYITSFRHTAQAIGWSLLSWVCFWLFFYLTLLALGDRIAPQDRLAISLGALALSPPSSATQPGLFHGSVTVPLAAVGFDEVILLAYAILLHIVEMFWIILLAIWGLLRTGVSLSVIRDR
ncbi:MAG: flippase-like domain-containing protein [Chloroflexi bacterium]|nr:flippase-like domain-containing protein [Chloroflexota bacterium]